MEQYRLGRVIEINANRTAIPSNSGENTNSGSSSQTTATDTTDTTDAAQLADASQSANAAAGTGSTTDTTAQNGTNGTSQNRKVTIVNPEVGEEEEQVAQIEESVVTEEVAEVEGSDLNADEADGGVIVETVGNSYPAWIWLLVVLACAAAAILLFIVFKRRKEEEK
jgi:cobalamin biosynthesis Mg chelatase CobN